MSKKELAKKPSQRNKSHPEISKKESSGQQQLIQIELTSQGNKNIKKTDIKLTDMEAYHRHKIHPNRKLTDYVLEFFMIFIAITGGFFMENLREYKVERHKEKEYITSMILDIQSDTANLQSIIRQHQRINKGIDSLMSSIQDPNIKVYEFFRLSNYITEYTSFSSRNLTITQLKNSGGFRLLENKTVTDSIVDYYSKCEGYEDQMKFFFKKVSEVVDLEMEIFDLRRLLVKNKMNKMDLKDNDIKRLYNQAVAIRGLRTNEIIRLQGFYKQGSSLLNYLNKEYKIKM